MHQHKSPSIVIVGGGAGGLVLATLLGRKLGRRKLATITLVDNSLTHVWRPLWHEVAAGTLNLAENQIEYISHAYTNHYHFELGSLEQLHRTKKTITVGAVTNKQNEIILPSRIIHYDYLVIAIGSISNNFSVSGAAEYCFYLDSYWQSRLFQKNFFDFLLQAQATAGAKKQQTIAIIGGGATGVELAAELHYAIYLMQRYRPQHIISDQIKIIIIEAAPRILVALPERLSAMATTQLKKRDIEIFTNERVTRITATDIYTQNGLHIPADIKIWAAGIKGADLLRHLDGLEVTTTNQLRVNDLLQTTFDKNITAFGDCAYCENAPHYIPIPPRAQAAAQEAKYLVQYFKNQLSHKTTKAFRYHDYGSIITFARRSAIGNLMGNIGTHLHITIEGLLARLAYWWLYKRHQIILLGWSRVALITALNWLRPWKSRLKLH